MRDFFHFCLGYCLKFFKYRLRKDPFEEFSKKSIDINFVKASNNKVALIVPLRVSPTSNVFEGIVAFSLRLRGYKVYSLMFGTATSYNENMTIKSQRIVNNSISFYDQKRFNKVFGTKGLFYNDLIDNKVKKEIRLLSTKTPIDQVFNWEIENVNVGKHVEAGVARYLLKSTIDLALNEVIIREFFYTALLTFYATNSAIEKINPNFAIMSHGCYSSWGTCLEVFKQSEVRCVVWGRGYAGKGSIIASQKESYLFEYVYEPKSNWKNLDLNKDSFKKNKIVDYLKSKRNPNSGVDHVSYYKDVCSSDLDERSFKSKFNIPMERVIVGFYPNIPWDGKMFSATTSFPTLECWVHETINWLQKSPNCHLVIRCHPAEKACIGNESMETFSDLLDKYKKEHGLPNNITVLAPDSEISSYQLSEFASCAIMYGSTLAMEFTAVGHPVIQVGLNNSSYKGGVFDVNSVSHYHQLLEKIKTNDLLVTETMKSDALNYAYHWIFRRHIPETLINLKNLEFDGFLFDDAAILDQGKNLVLDRFIECCESGAPFVFDRE